MNTYRQNQLKRTARLAGVCYVLLGIVAVLGLHHAPLVQRDLGALVRAMAVTEGHFRFRVVADVLSAVLAVPLALLLYELFRSVSERLAALLALLLLVAVPISFVLALDYVAAHWMLTGAPVVAGIVGAEREALAMLFLGLHVHGVFAVEIFWGLWLLPFGVLIIRSRFLPRVLGILLLLGGVAYVAHSIAMLLLGGDRIILYEQVTMLARAAAEFPTMLWLLVKGADAHKANPAAD